MGPIEGEAFSWFTGGTRTPARAEFSILWRGYLYSPSILGESVQTARVYHRVDETPRARTHVRLRFSCSKPSGDNGVNRGDGREPGLITLRAATGGYVPVVRCERVQGARSVNKALSSCGVS